VKGHKVNYFNGDKTAFDYKIKPYPNPNFLERDILTDGVLSTANYIIFKPEEQASTEIFPEGSPMIASGIQPGDRILWADGVFLFSLQQLQKVLNDGKVLLTVQRGSEILQRRVPRVHIEELKLTPDLKEEFIDWQHEAELTDLRVAKLYAIPYNLNPEGVVESALKFIDRDKHEEIFPSQLFSSLDQPLSPGDKIIAIDGQPIKQAYQLFYLLQQHQVNLIVQRSSQVMQPENWRNADEQFDKEINWEALAKIANSVGTDAKIVSLDNLFLLNPVTPKPVLEFATTQAKQNELAIALSDQRKSLENIEDPEKRAQALQLFESRERQLVLGLPSIHDKPVNYNPNPFTQFANVLKEIWHTLVAVFTGNLSPKWMAGPIGIVQMSYISLMVSIKEALFWLGAISLNLGILNLMPIPVLDGGYICMFLMEMITRKRLKLRSMEKLIIPFAVLLIGCIIYFTYNDLLRLFTVYIK
jgi:regulator of sigma E protease